MDPAAAVPADPLEVHKSKRRGNQHAKYVAVTITPQKDVSRTKEVAERVTAAEVEEEDSEEELDRTPYMRRSSPTASRCSYWMRTQQVTKRPLKISQNSQMMDGKPSS